jgi:hypothetical protein
MLFFSHSELKETTDILFHISPAYQLISFTPFLILHTSQLVNRRKTRTPQFSGVKSLLRYQEVLVQILARRPAIVTDFL